MTKTHALSRRPHASLALAIALAALVATACGGEAGQVASTAPSASAPPPTPSPTAAPTPTPVATPAPTPAPSQPTTGRIVVADPGFEVTLPDGWTSLPVDPDTLQSFINELPAGSDLRGILESQAGSLATQAIRFWAFDTRPEDLAKGFARNMNVIAQPPLGLGVAAIEPIAKASLEAVEAVREPVTTEIVTLPSGDALRVDYILDVEAADGTATAVAGTQYYLPLPNALLIISFSSDEASAEVAATDFDAIIRSVQPVP